MREAAKSGVAINDPVLNAMLATYEEYTMMVYSTIFAALFNSETIANRVTILKPSPHSFTSFLESLLTYGNLPETPSEVRTAIDNSLLTQKLTRRVTAKVLWRRARAKVKALVRLKMLKPALEDHRRFKAEERRREKERRQQALARKQHASHVQTLMVHSAESFCVPSTGRQGSHAALAGRAGGRSFAGGVADVIVGGSAASFPGHSGSGGGNTLDDLDAQSVTTGSRSTLSGVRSREGMHHDHSRTSLLSVGDAGYRHPSQSLQGRQRHQYASREGRVDFELPSNTMTPRLAGARARSTHRRVRGQLSLTDSQVLETATPDGEEDDNGVETSARIPHWTQRGEEDIYSDEEYWAADVVRARTVGALDDANFGGDDSDGEEGEEGLGAGDWRGRDTLSGDESAEESEQRMGRDSGRPNSARVGGRNRRQSQTDETMRQHFNFQEQDGVGDLSHLSSTRSHQYHPLNLRSSGRDFDRDAAGDRGSWVSGSAGGGSAVGTPRSGYRTDRRGYGYRYGAQRTDERVHEPLGSRIRNRDLWVKGLQRGMARVDTALMEVSGGGDGTSAGGVRLSGGIRGATRAITSASAGGRLMDRCGSTEQSQPGTGIGTRRRLVPPARIDGGAADHTSLPEDNLAGPAIEAASARPASREAAAESVMGRKSRPNLQIHVAHNNKDPPPLARRDSPGTEDSEPPPTPSFRIREVDDVLVDAAMHGLGGSTARRDGVAAPVVPPPLFSPGTQQMVTRKLSIAVRTTACRLQHGSVNEGKHLNGLNWARADCLRYN